MSSSPRPMPHYLTSPESALINVAGVTLAPAEGTCNEDPALCRPPLTDDPDLSWLMQDRALKHDPDAGEKYAGPGWIVRHGGQDALLLVSRGPTGVLGVADGVSSSSLPRYLAIGSLLAMAKASEAWADPNKLINAGLNGIWRKKNQFVPPLPHPNIVPAQTTLSVASIDVQNPGAPWLHYTKMGDSPIYTYGRHGFREIDPVPERASLDTLESAVRARRLRHAQDDDRLPDVKQLPLAPGEVVVVASDGLCEKRLTKNTVEAVLRWAYGKKWSARQVVESLTEQALNHPNGHSDDDLTVAAGIAPR